MNKHFIKHVTLETYATQDGDPYSLDCGFILLVILEYLNIKILKNEDLNRIEHFTTNSYSVGIKAPLDKFSIFFDCEDLMYKKDFDQDHINTVFVFQMKDYDFGICETYNRYIVEGEEIDAEFMLYCSTSNLY